MSLTTFNLYTREYDSIAPGNYVAVNLYKEIDPDAVYRSLDTSGTPGPVPARTWVFPGIERVNYKVLILQMSGGSPVEVLADFFVTPPASSSVRVMAPFRIKPGITPGATPGEFVAVFDGSETFPGSGIFTEDLRGWSITQLDRGYVIADPDLSYVWNSLLGRLELSSDYGPFQDYSLDPAAAINLQFLPIVEETADSGLIGGEIYAGTKIITTGYDILAADVGVRLILRGESESYFEVNLPPLSTVVPGRLLTIQSLGGTDMCVKINENAADSNSIEFQEGGRSAVYICKGETIVLYRLRLSNTESVWAPDDGLTQGNWNRLGNEFSNYGDGSIIKNAQRLNGGGVSQALNIFETARFYNDFVLKLPPDRLVPFASWSANKTKYSLASGNLYHIPDVSGLYPRASTATLLPSTYMVNSVGPHVHPLHFNTFVQSGSSTPCYAQIPEIKNPSNYRGDSGINSGTSETRPETYVTGRFVWI